MFFGAELVLRIMIVLRDRRNQKYCLHSDNWQERANWEFFTYLGATWCNSIRRLQSLFQRNAMNGGPGHNALPDDDISPLTSNVCLFRTWAWFWSERLVRQTIAANWRETNVPRRNAKLREALIREACALVVVNFYRGFPEDRYHMCAEHREKRGVFFNLGFWGCGTRCQWYAVADRNWNAENEKRLLNARILSLMIKSGWNAQASMYLNLKRRTIGG